MPELPEVNTLAIALEKRLRGDGIAEWQRISPRLRQPIPDADAVQKLIGKRIIAVRRVAKSIYFDFGNTDFLRIHLGMTGYFLLSDKLPVDVKHAHLRILMVSGRILTFCDPRRFGAIEIVAFPGQKVVEPFAGELTANYLTAVCANRSCSIKSLLMDQQIIAGLGNIYASEALFKAGVRPDRAAGSLKPREIKTITRACIEVIDDALSAGINSLSQQPEINRDTTHFEIDTRVYDQQGTKCRQCRRDTIEMIRISGRSSYYCPACQR
jgi:formamidopyrimidine-DNA glycosylase